MDKITWTITKVQPGKGCLGEVWDLAFVLTINGILTDYEFALNKDNGKTWIAPRELKIYDHLNIEKLSFEIHTKIVNLLNKSMEKDTYNDISLTKYILINNYMKRNKNFGQIIRFFPRLNLSIQNKFFNLRRNFLSFIMEILLKP